MYEDLDSVDDGDDDVCDNDDGDDDDGDDDDGDDDDGDDNDDADDGDDARHPGAAVTTQLWGARPPFPAP